MFKKRNWKKWEHVTFVEDFRQGITTYELMKRTCLDTGDIEWKSVKVKSCVHSLAHKLNLLSTQSSQE